MTSKGFDILIDSEGKGFLGCMAAIVILAAMIFAGIKLGPIYYANYGFEEDLKDLTSRAGARYMDNNTIIEDVLKLAKKNNINLKPKEAKENIKIERTAGLIYINVLYYESVDFLFFQKTLEFKMKLSSFTAG